MATKRAGTKKKGVHPLEAKVGRSYDDALKQLQTPRWEGALPAAEPPKLSELRVRIPPPEPVTEDDVLVHFVGLLRQKATRRDRAEGEPLALGDEVQLDVVGYVDNRLLPGSIRVGAWLDLEPMAHLPGFAETLAGVRVGDACALDLQLPADYPVASVAGKMAHCLCEVRAAREVNLPSAESPDALAALGLGDSLEEVMASVTKQVDDERVALQDLRAQELALGALADATRLELPRAMVDEELRRRWSMLEAPLLKQKDFAPDELREALEAWMSSELLRAEAERSLRISLALDAVGKRDRVELLQSDVAATLAELAATIEIDERELASALDASLDLQQRAANLARHQALVAHVLSQVQFEEAVDGG